MFASLMKPILEVKSIRAHSARVCVLSPFSTQGDGSVEPTLKPCYRLPLEHDTRDRPSSLDSGEPRQCIRPNYSREVESWASRSAISKSNCQKYRYDHADHAGGAKLMCGFSSPSPPGERMAMSEPCASIPAHSVLMLPGIIRPKRNRWI